MPEAAANPEPFLHQHPTFGKIRSGVVVPTSTSRCRPARHRRSRSRHGRVDRPDRSSSRARRRYAGARCRCDVRIHSSDVSTIFSRSKLVRTFSGRYLPVPLCANTFCWLILDELPICTGTPLRASTIAAHGRFERDLIGAAVALQHDAVQTDETRTVVATRIQARADRVERRLGQPVPGHSRSDVAVNSCFRNEPIIPRDALHGLDRDIADEAVADDDIDVGVKDAVALDETDVVESAPPDSSSPASRTMSRCL
jgi:hypothetical protein